MNGDHGSQLTKNKINTNEYTDQPLIKLLSPYMITDTSVCVQSYFSTLELYYMTDIPIEAFCYFFAYDRETCLEYFANRPQYHEKIRNISSAPLELKYHNLPEIFNRDNKKYYVPLDELLNNIFDGFIWSVCHEYAEKYLLNKFLHVGGFLHKLINYMANHTNSKIYGSLFSNYFEKLPSSQKCILIAVVGFVIAAYSQDADIVLEFLRHVQIYAKIYINYRFGKIYHDSYFAYIERMGFTDELFEHILFSNANTKIIDDYICGRDDKKYTRELCFDIMENPIVEIYYDQDWQKLWKLYERVPFNTRLLIKGVGTPSNLLKIVVDMYKYIKVLISDRTSANVISTLDNFHAMFETKYPLFGSIDHTDKRYKKLLNDIKLNILIEAYRITNYSLYVVAALSLINKKTELSMWIHLVPLTTWIKIVDIYGRNNIEQKISEGQYTSIGHIFREIFNTPGLARKDVYNWICNETKHKMVCKIEFEPFTSDCMFYKFQYEGVYRLRFNEQKAILFGPKSHTPQLKKHEQTNVITTKNIVISGTILTGIYILAKLIRYKRA